VPQDAHVDRDRAGSAPSHYQGIDLDVLDCGAVIEKQAPERKRRLCKRTGIARGLPAKPGKKFGELQLSEHACHVILCDRQEPQGDIAGGRLLLTRAAEAGDARSALALGATYDPSVLGKLGVLGVRPNPEKARAWYAKAAEYGSGEATRRLERIAQSAR